jgi:hypothetical protein
MLGTGTASTGRCVGILAKCRRSTRAPAARLSTGGPSIRRHTGLYCATSGEQAVAPCAWLATTNLSVNTTHYLAPISNGCGSTSWHREPRHRVLQGTRYWAAAGRLKPLIEGIASLTDQDKRNIFEDVPRKAFPSFIRLDRAQHSRHTVFLVTGQVADVLLLAGGEDDRRDARG